MGKGIFGGMFDFDGDGELDAFEQATEFMLISELMKDEKKERNEFDDDGFEDED